jgi:hypothetical protein
MSEEREGARRAQQRLELAARLEVEEDDDCPFFLNGIQSNLTSYRRMATGRNEELRVS